MAYLEELLPEFRKGAKIRLKEWGKDFYIHIKSGRCWDERGARFSFQIDDLMSGNWDFSKNPNWTGNTLLITNASVGFGIMMKLIKLWDF